MNKPKDLRHSSSLVGVKPDEHYKRTWSDEMGPEGADLFRALNWMIIPLVSGIGIGVALAFKRGLPPSNGLALTYIVVGGLLGGIIFGGGAFLFVWGVSQGAGEAIGSFVQPMAEYKRDYSREDSLVAKGDIAGAIESFRVIAAAEPDNLEARLRAAELHRQKSEFEEASALYREVQAKAQRPRDDIHASLRLIDLYTIWPEHEGRSMRELRRLVDKYPGSEVEKRCRAALATLKSERFPGEG